MGALQIAHDVHIFPVGSIAVLLYRFGRHMDGDVARLEYHRYGLRLGSIVVHMLQPGAVEEGIFAYRGHSGGDSDLLYARAVPEYASGDGLQ